MNSTFKFFRINITVITILSFFIVSTLQNCSNDDLEIKAVSKPELSFPRNQSLVFDNLSVELKWKNSNSIGLSGPLNYTIYLDTNDFPTTKIETTRIPEYVVKNLNYDVEYKWRVEASIDGVTEKSEVFSFIIKKTSEVERNALIAIYDALGGDGWANRTNWKSSQSIGTWYGVSLDNKGNVSGLALSGNNLTGSIPEEIENLTHLKSLDLSENNFGTSIQPKIGNLGKLESLNLRNSSFVGRLPNDITKLAVLRFLNFSENSIIGGLPSNIGDLGELRHLQFNNNDITGSLPVSMGNLRKLQILIGNSNSINGEIPATLANINSLRRFLMADNFLEGTLPNFSAAPIQIINLNNNPSLSGSLEQSGLCRSGLQAFISSTSISGCP